MNKYTHVDGNIASSIYRGDDVRQRLWWRYRPRGEDGTRVEGAEG
jgi:hypothetical protein